LEKRFKRLRSHLQRIDLGKNVIVYRPIGIIHSPFKNVRGVPIQPRAAGFTWFMLEIIRMLLRLGDGGVRLD